VPFRRHFAQAVHDDVILPEIGAQRRPSLGYLPKVHFFI
jgi:hypothetical protein